MAGQFGFSRWEATLYQRVIDLAGYPGFYSDYFRVSKLVADGAQALDCGCGAGLLAITFAKEYVLRRGQDVRVHAVDISPAMLDRALREARAHGVEKHIRFYLGDCRDLSSLVRYPAKEPAEIAAGSMDCVLTSGMLEYVTERQRTCDEMLRVLRPGGRMMLSAINPNAYGRLVARLWSLEIYDPLALFEGSLDLQKADFPSKNLPMQKLKSIYEAVRGEAAAHSGSD